MALRFDIELTEDERVEMAALPATSWFTGIEYQNASSPEHPNRRMAAVADMKHAMVGDWMSEAVKGKRVLDLFSANGAFSAAAVLAGAREVVGVEFDEERVRCAEFVARTLKSDVSIRHIHGDVYQLADYLDEPFDVVLCLGGMYHVADPAHVFRQIRAVTGERLLLQTAQVLPIPGNWARFVVRRTDKTARGMTSIQGGYGTWHCSPGSLRELLYHGGFQVSRERQPPLLKRRQFPWYIADCRPL